MIGRSTTTLVHPRRKIKNMKPFRKIFSFSQDDFIFFPPPDYCVLEYHNFIQQVNGHPFLKLFCTYCLIQYEKSTYPVYPRYVLCITASGNDCLYVIIKYGDDSFITIITSKSYGQQGHHGYNIASALHRHSRFFEGYMFVIHVRFHHCCTGIPRCHPNREPF